MKKTTKNNLKNTKKTNKKDTLDEQKWNNFKLTLQLVSITLALAFGNKICMTLNWDGFIPRFLVYFVIVIIALPLLGMIQKYVEKTPALRKFFEEK